MDSTIKAAVIGAIATISGSIIGGIIGKTDAIRDVVSQVNIEDSNIELSIDTKDDLIELINDLITQNAESARENGKLEYNNTELQKLNDSLKNEKEALVEENISLNNQLSKYTSLVDENNKLKDELENLQNEKGQARGFTENQGKETSTEKNDKNIAEANLFDKYINKSISCGIQKSDTDSYGNFRSDVLYFNGQPSHSIIFVLDQEYSFLKFSVAISDDASSDKSGNIIVKADDKTVYTSDKLDKKTKPFTLEDIVINNCDLLTIEYNASYDNQCIIFDAIVYNKN